jgi:hypothetical protein
MQNNKNSDDEEIFYDKNENWKQKVLDGAFLLLMPHKFHFCSDEMQFSFLLFYFFI